LTDPQSPLAFILAIHPYIRDIFDQHDRNHT
jgi:hypothetical protein